MKAEFSDIHLESHPLDRMLKPRSVGLVGASARPASNGLALVQMCRIDGYEGRIYPVNPNYTEIDGLQCYPSLADLPETVDLVALAVRDEHLESAFDEALKHGAGAVVLFGSAQLASDSDLPLATRLSQKARSYGVMLCGPNSMGFYTPSIGLRIAGFPSEPGLRNGGIAYIAQSGSAFSALAHNERRLGFVVCISTGSELGANAADYLDWALQQPNIRVVGLFLEQLREPKKFTRALENARLKNIPVVILKVGRTARSAAMALSHTGAIAGNDQAFAAVCRRYGAIVVNDLDELAATLQFLDQSKRISSGDLATIHDSGGQRELVVDIAESLGVDFAEIDAGTRSKIQPYLEFGHTAENPLDAWGTARAFSERYAGAMGALVADPAVSAGVFFTDLRDDYWYSKGVVEAVVKVSKETEKPVAIGTSYSKTSDSKTALMLAQQGIPVLEGARETLLAYRHAVTWRDHIYETEALNAIPSTVVIERWRTRLRNVASLSEQEGLALLNDFGVTASVTRLVRNSDEASSAAEELGFALAMKTAEGHMHKSEVKGVHLHLNNSEQVRLAYSDLSRRLGPRVLISRMAPAGVEVALGCVIDPEFGPLVVVSAGGTLIEYFRDAVSALAPISEEGALSLVKELKISKVLAGVRGQPPANIQVLGQMISRFSEMIATLSDVLSEVDVNPVIVGESGAVAVDVLVLAKKERRSGH